MLKKQNKMMHISKIESMRKLNTKGCCFLCLQSENIKTEEVEGNQVLKSISIWHLLRHLQIPTAQFLVNGGSLSGEDFKNEIQVDLCENCGHAISRFAVLFQKLEKIQLEMNYFLESIHKSISQSAKDSDLVQSYSKRMTSDLEALSQLAFVDNLRKQVASESFKKMNVPRLQIILTRTDMKQIKREDSGETCEANDGEFTESSFADDISPPPSLNSNPDNKEDVNLDHFASASSLKEKGYSSLKSSIKEKTAAGKRGQFFTKHPSTEMYECKRCDKKSKCRQTITAHFKTIHLKLRHKCDICNVSVFSNISTLIKHKKTCLQKLRKQKAKEKDPRFKFICKICGRKFETSRKLVAHRRCVHKNANRFQCDLCNKKYKSKLMLKNHQAAIHQSRKFNCKGCNKKYTYMQELKKHEKKCLNKSKIKLESVDCV